MRQPQKPQQPSVFASSAGGLSAVAGIAIAFLLAPQLYALGAGWVGQYGGHHYSADWVELFRLAFLGLLAYFLFNLTRLLSYALFASLGLWLGTVALSRSKRDLP
ncbi:hypothetical protein ACG74X_10170 [Marivita sp. S0852]|uniref:hypothetical protein n=1 Tax=Marivita sp. S0852 TaxID=3373893 RepID=UPI0039827674